MEERKKEAKAHHFSIIQLNNPSGLILWQENMGPWSTRRDQINFDKFFDMIYVTSTGLSIEKHMMREKTARIQRLTANNFFSEKSTPEENWWGWRKIKFATIKFDILQTVAHDW